MGRLPSTSVISQMIQDGTSVIEIAKKYGVTRQAVYDRLRAEEHAKQGTVNTSKYGINHLKGVQDAKNMVIDPETGYMVANTGSATLAIGRMGDERVTAFVKYHMAMMEMRQGVNKKDVNDLYQRFYRYLAYCAEHGIMPNNMSAYFAIGVARQDISAWHRGVGGTPEHRQFADDIMAFFASVHEQAPTDGLMNPISAMFWQKAHDGMVEATKLETVQDDPLGDKKSASDIMRQYEDVQLPDD